MMEMKIIMNKINIKILSDDALETFIANIEYVYKQIKLNPRNNSWIYSLLPENSFRDKKYKIEDFELTYSENGNYKEVDYENSLLLYKNLKDIPRRILTDEKFWLWLYLDKFYEVAVQAMEIKSTTTLLDHWTFKQGGRRGLFFGALSRSYFRVELSIDETLEDKFELTKYIIEKPERFRTLSWRSFSNQKKIVLGALKAQKEFEEKYPDKMRNAFYNLISKRISRYGSVNLLDAVTEEEIYNVVYNNLMELSDME